MATLLISAAVNIGVGLLLNALFPPPDIEQEGPRLADLGFTSAAYGKFVNIVFGTDRIDGNIIDTTDPAIEEVVTRESQSAGGKGGGQEINTTTYTYFFTGRIAFCIEGATDLIRLWGDGKMIYDATGTTQLIRSGVGLVFYSGGPNQNQDSEEVSRRGANIPAYRHLTTVKLDRMPLADFGNRIPNMTAEIAFDSDVQTPFVALDEPASGIDVPGSLAGADRSYMAFDPTRNYLISLKTGEQATWTANATTMEFIQLVGSGGLSKPGYGLNGFVYCHATTGNHSPLQKRDIETGEVVDQFGDQGGISIVDDANGFANSGHWSVLSVSVPGVGVRTAVFHAVTSGTANGSIVDGDALATPFHIFSTADGLPAQGMNDAGVFIPDHDRGIMYWFTENDAANRYELFRMVPQYSVGLAGIAPTGVTIEKVRDFSRGSTSNDFNGVTNGTVMGWAVNRVTGDLILSNAVTVLLYNPITDTILAKRQDTQMRGRNNYYSGTLFAYGSGDGSSGNIRVIDTRDLTVIRDIDTDTIPWPGDDPTMHDPSLVWDDRVSALFLSRVDTGSNAPVDSRVLKVFVNRIEGLGVGLDFVVQSLSTKYQRQVMAGLETTDIDVTTLASDTVFGYTINRKSTMRSALEPLRQRYFFDAVSSDWIIKFPKRGQAPVLTIPEEDVGLLKRGRDQNEEPAIQEVRQDDLELPMSLAIRYRNKDSDYQSDYERNKRHLFPNPTMRSRSEQTIDMPIVDTATNIKQTAEKQLFTMWNERVSYKTVVPWTYIKLDASDVFQLGVFGETARLRMAENDLGAGWAIDITGIVEDTRTFISVIGGGLHLGHIQPAVPSSLPTRIVPLDAPVLDEEDMLFTGVSNAYMAVSGFESSWPGGTVYKSINNVNFTPTGTVNVEAIVAKVNTPPGQWGFNAEGDFPNRIQEVNEGGSMVITNIRGPSFWASTTEFDMLTGGNNTIAVANSDGGVEILSYVDVTDNGDNTLTLERLLRGRLGTEDIADAGLDVNAQVIGLIDSTGAKQDASIVRQRLALSELDSPLFFKGVTIGTLLEDAVALSFTYTGRDIKPYSPVQGVATPDGFNGLDVSWERRTRGPFLGEWVDGTGTVPLNENIEQYDVQVIDGTNSVGPFVVNNSTSTNLTEAQLDGALDGDNLFSNTILLLGFEGVDGATESVDDSEDNRSLTFFGNAQIDTAQFKFGASSLLLDGAGDYVLVPHSSDFSIGTGDFAIEMFFRPNELGRTQTLIGKRPTGFGDQEFLFLFTSGNVLQFRALQSVITFVTGTTTLSTGVWYHCAISRQGTTFRLFLDGSLENTVEQAATPNTNTADVRIGRNGGASGNDLNGWLDELRFTKGAARYIEPFTAPTAPHARFGSAGGPKVHIRQISETGKASPPHIIPAP